MQVYDIGEPRELTSTWYDADGDGTDPSTVVLTVTHPNGATDTYNKAQLTQGDTNATWLRWITPDAEGVWRYDFVGTVDGFNVEQGGMFLVGVGTSTSPTGPCEPWTTWDDVVACGSSTLSDVNPQQQEYAIDIASEILFNLSGRVYPGICTITRSLCLSCRHCLPVACSCEPVNGIDLGIAAPVWGAWDVIADGATLPASAYTVHDRRYLVRTDGNTWPTSGSTDRLLDPNTFRATWAYGRPIPAGGRAAARMFATEIGKLCVADKTCQIPQRVTSVNREGMSFTILDSMKMIEEGRTGLALVDLWLVADKKGRKAKPGIFAPGAGSGSRMIA
jgi:hypothetical protein